MVILLVYEVIQQYHIEIANVFLYYSFYELMNKVTVQFVNMEISKLF